MEPWQQEASHPLLSLLDWKRQIHELYAVIRADTDPKRAWTTWRAQRDRLFRHHPQSPLPPSRRDSFGGLDYFDYDERARVAGAFEPLEDATAEVPGSVGSPFATQRFGNVVFELYGRERRLEIFWIGGYGGGALLPFRDATSSDTTYGGGRYLLDTVKGADLGGEADRLTLDFNFTYNPSCSYDPRWACPLAPPANILDCEVAAGERHRGEVVSS